MGESGLQFLKILIGLALEFGLEVVPACSLKELCNNFFKEQVHLVFFLDRPVRLVLESYNLCGIMYSYMPITYMN